MGKLYKRKSDENGESVWVTLRSSRTIEKMIALNQKSTFPTLLILCFFLVILIVMFIAFWSIISV